ncbi:MAG: SUMF1/EgtB/PvdO family nonheme iron enzyme [Armatimonadota bacterium]
MHRLNLNPWISILILLVLALPVNAAAPSITSFQPDNGKVGDVITITGTSLTGASVVKVNGTSAPQYTVTSATSIEMTIPSGATTGKIAITTPGGTATSTTDLTVWTPNSLDLTLDLGYGYLGTAPNASISYRLSGVNNYTGSVPVNGGNITITGIRPGGYALNLYGSHWLRRSVSGLDLSNSNSYASALANGDADGDNMVNLFDIVVLDQNFASSNSMADLDGNGIVNLFDYVIIDVFFGALGDMDSQPRRNPVDNAEMVWVSNGNFLRGSSSDYPTEERPQSSIYLSGYWIYKNEVTVAQYRQFCQATSRSMPTEPVWGWQDTHPVVNVTWQDAADYAAWAGAALPTEAQWEKAARGGDARLYPWGNAWDASKCVNYNNSDTTKPVGSVLSGISLYGCMDMAGNVWEWCADWYGANYYQTAPANNPPGAASGTYRVVRGGSWFNGYSGDLRVACRNYAMPTRRSSDTGFRCIKLP